jgi:hypothetical protein
MTGSAAAAGALLGVAGVSVGVVALIAAAVLLTRKEQR